MESDKELAELELTLEQAGKYVPIESPVKHFWTDREGNKLSFKQFISRWKKGIEGITPQQKIKTQILGTRIILLGLFLGLIVSLIAWRNFWWVAIVLTGALINTTIQYLGLIQQMNILRNIYEQVKGGNET